MKKILNLSLSILLITIFFFSLSTQKIYASCTGFPDVPISVDPSSGDQNTTYKVTLLWDRLSADQRKIFQDQIATITIGLKEGGNPIPVTGDTLLDHGYNSGTASVHDLKNPSNLSEGTHQLSVAVYLNYSPQCSIETPTTTITVTKSLANVTKDNPDGITAKEGDICNPGLQNQCPTGTSCQVPTGGNSFDKYTCTKDKDGASTLEKLVNFIGYSYRLINPDKDLDTLPCTVSKSADGKNFISDNKKAALECNVVSTAIGDINVSSPYTFVTKLFSLILSIAGLGAMIMIIYSGYKMLISRGNKEVIQGARETITSAIVGLIFIIFSLVILSVIGGSILKLPGFG